MLKHNISGMGHTFVTGFFNGSGNTNMQRQAVSKILLYEWEVVITVPSRKCVKTKTFIAQL